MPPWLSKIPWESPWIAPVFFFLLSLLFFSGIIFNGRREILSDQFTDLPSLFIPWREFGFEQIRQFNWPLWNPHVFSGIPFFSEIQSALLYPPNWIHLIFPIHLALNLGFALNVFMAGYFTYLWCRYREISKAGSMLAGVLFMFSGPFYSHLFAGHISLMSVMAWGPFVFLATDGLLKSGDMRWCLLGVLAVTMQVLAGYPQYCYYTAIVLGVYVCLSIIRSEKRMRVLSGVALFYVGALALSAVQLLPTLDAAGESVRNGGVSYDFAASFSFPPESLITLITPGFFGGVPGVPYFGRWYSWEATAFVGSVSLLLCLWGALRVEKKARNFAVTMTLVSILLALGSYTPLHRVLYHILPGFNLFRGAGKFIYLASLFVALLAGLGFDALVRTERWPKKLACIALALGLTLSLLAIMLSAAGSRGTEGAWGSFIGAIEHSGQTFPSEPGILPVDSSQDAGWLRLSSFYASGQIVRTAVWVFSVTVLLFLMRFSKRFAYGILLLAVLEMYVYAVSATTSFVQDHSYPSVWKQAIKDLKVGERVLFTDRGRSQLWSQELGLDGIWGYDPCVLKRYAEWMTFTQREDVNTTTNYVTFKQTSPLFALVRCRYALMSGKESQALALPHEPLPRLFLANNWQVITSRDEILNTLDSDPIYRKGEKIILESEPDPLPGTGLQKGTASVVGFSTDYLDIEADLPEPAILVVTDAYCSGWRVIPLTPGPQESYSVMPADYILRAIPLSAGKHHFRLEYAPASFRIGRIISLLSLIAYAGLAGLSLRKFGRFIKRRAAQRLDVGIRASS